MSTKTSDYDFAFPKELIASHPVNPKDSAKLLVYDRKTDKIIHTVFKNILSFIPKDTAIFLNDTKVIKARIFGQKSTGAKVELLFQKPIGENEFLVNIRGKVKAGSKLIFDDNLTCIVKKLNDDGSRIVEFFKNEKKISLVEVFEIFEKIGHVPLPPYIKRDDNKEDEKNYQSIFAKNQGAVAAPTASLHFTKELFEQLKKQFHLFYITLHVGAGTFKPLTTENILEHKMHSEYYKIPQNSKDIINSNTKILCVGTTVARTIEYYARTHLISGNNDLFLHPQNPPIRVDYLLTNFHLPKSTLLMLVSSFVGREKTLQIYKEAVDKEYRFFSYGDAMLIL